MERQHSPECTAVTHIGGVCNCGMDLAPDPPDEPDYEAAEIFCGTEAYPITDEWTEVRHSALANLKRAYLVTRAALLLEEILETQHLRAEVERLDEDLSAARQSLYEVAAQRNNLLRENRSE